ncbi:MAG: tetratricopeptide repeat protein [Thermodesulfobacteriota bacterium]
MRRTILPELQLSAPLALRLGGLGLVILIAVLYWPALGADFVGFDDYYYVFRNPNVLRGLNWADISWAFTSFRECNWHPLTWLSLMLDAELYGLAAPGYHATNVLLHVANSLLFLTLLYRTTGRLLPSLAAAALFAAHPLHVESVAWVSERKDVLSTFFWLACMLAYAEYAASPSKWRYLSSLGLFCLGLMAKPMLVTLPCVLLLFDYWPLRRVHPPERAGKRLLGVPLPGRRLLLEKLPFFALAMVVSMVTLIAQNTTMSGLDQIPLHIRLLNAGAAYLAYLTKTALPLGLAPFYPHPFGNVSVLGGLAGIGIVSILSALAWRQAAARPFLFVGWFWFLGTLIPVIGLVQVGSQAWADRYVYVPHLGLFLALVWAGAEMAGRLRLSSRITASVFLVLLAGLSVLAHRQAGYWVNSETLFTHAANVTEGNYVAEIVLADSARMKGDWAEHYRRYNLAVQYNSHYVSYRHAQEGFYSLVYGRFDAAMRSLVQSLELNPHNGSALINLAATYAFTGRYAEALEVLARAEAVRPDLPKLKESRENIRKAMEERRSRLANPGSGASDSARGAGQDAPREAEQ